MRRFFRQQRLLSSLAALLWHCSLSWAGAGVGGWAPKIFAQAFCGERRSRRMPDLGHASHVATGSARFAGFRPPAGTAFSLLFCGLPFLRPQSGARQLVRLLLFGSATFSPASFIGQPTTCCSDLSLSVLVLRLGLNSVLFTSLSTNHWRSSLSAFPAIQSTRRFCRLQRLVVVAYLLSLDHRHDQSEGGYPSGSCFPCADVWG